MQIGDSRHQENVFSVDYGVENQSFSHKLWR